MILRTKLNLPQIAFHQIFRTRLYDLLSQGIQRKLTVVSAPAGFGKTTLVAGWLNQTQIKYAWFSIDQKDNEAQQFLEYVLVGLQNISPTLGKSAMLRLEKSKGEEIEKAIIHLINDIEAFGEPLVLVLEDYHFVESNEVHTAVNFLLDHVPSNLHLVLVSRTDPPFSFARLRIMEQVTEIRTPEIRFNHSEIGAYFKESYDVELSKSECATLLEKTEGWIASLQLIGQTLKKTPKTSIMEAMNRNNHHMMDYLLDEVLESIPAQACEFLFKTSILSRFCAPLCDAVVPVSPGNDFGSSQEILDYLLSINLFVVPLDEEREWFRYHHLFGQYLQKRLASADEKDQLHGQASRWFEKEGWLDEAIEHALVCDDKNQAASLLEAHCVLFWKRQDLFRLKQWCAEIDEGALQNHPLLCVFTALAQCWTMEFDKAKVLVAYAKKAENQDSEQPISSYRKAVESFLARMDREFEHSQILLDEGLEELKNNDDEISSLMKAFLMFSLAESTFLVNDLKRGNEQLALSIDFAKKGENASMYHFAAGMYAESLIFQGRLQDGMEVAKGCLDFMKRMIVKYADPRIDTLVAPQAISRIGMIHLERNELEKAEKYFLESMEQVYEADAQFLYYLKHCYVAKVKAAQGNHEEALKLLKQAEHLKNADDRMIEFGVMWADIVISQTKLALLANNSELNFFLPDVEKVLKGIDYPHDNNTDFFAAVINTTLGQYCYHAGEYEKALKLLERSRIDAKEFGKDGDYIKESAHVAAIYSKMNQSEKALELLAVTLKMAQPEGFVQSFVDVGPEMAKLLMQMPKSSALQDYCKRILEAFPRTKEIEALSKPSSTMSKTIYDNLIEPLKEREISILEALDGASTNQEIAAQLFLSINTVKWYVKNIYEKLGVNKRSEAVNKAKALGVIG